MIIVMYNPETDQIKLCAEALVQDREGWTQESEFVVWRSIEFAMQYGWEVIGEL